MPLRVSLRSLAVVTAALLMLAAFLAVRRRESVEPPVGRSRVEVGQIAGRRETLFHDTSPACASCSLALRHYATIGSVTDKVLLRDIPILERDSRGAIYAAVPRAVDHEVLVFSSDGSLLRTVGAFGSGPGELRAVSDIWIGAADTLFILHDGYVSAFDSTGVFVSKILLQPVVTATSPAFVGVTQARFLLTMSLAHDSLKLPIHAYGRDGQHLDAFGPRGIEGEYALERGHFFGKRTTGWDADESVWLLEHLTYRLEESNLTGNVQRVISILPPPSWDVPLLRSLDDYKRMLPAFMPPPTYGPPADEQPRREARRTLRRPARRPPTLFKGVAVRDSLLMVVTHLATPHWAAARGVIDTLRERTLPGYNQQLYDTVIDVIDKQRGVLLARTLIPSTIYISKRGLLYRPVVDRDGFIRSEVFDLSFTR